MYSQFARPVVCTLFYANMRPFVRQFDGSVHTERTRLATFTKLNSLSWGAQVRLKGKYVNETFLRRKDAEGWALEIERRIDRGESAIARTFRHTKTFGDLITLHREDLQEVGKRIGRSKAASLAFLDLRLGRLRIPELDRGRLIQFGKDRAREGAGPVTIGIDLGYIKTILLHAAAVHGVCRSSRSCWRAQRPHDWVWSEKGASATGGRHRTNSIAWWRLLTRIPVSKFRSGGSSASLLRPQCDRTKLAE
jgi:hypothetical protein